MAREPLLVTLPIVVAAILVLLVIGALLAGTGVDDY
jgi:hypothetical protein